MVRVCDAIMGNGKTSSVINYFNEHPDGKYIFITPYLEEAARIKQGCPGLHFIEPSNKIGEYDYKKKGHTAALIKEGHNIATTHQAFKNYDNDMLDDIQTQGYTLVIDENVEILEKYEVDEGDLELIKKAGYIKEENGVYSLVRDYNGKAFRELFDILKTRELITVIDRSGGKKKTFYWQLPPRLIKSFKDVFILTYLFEGQSLHHFLEIYHIPYEFIGIEKLGDGRFRFCELPGYTPEYVSRLGDMIHILDNEKLNSIGKNRHAISMSWFEKNEEGVKQLKDNIYNCYRHIWKDAAVNERLWATFVSTKTKLRGKGYTNSFLSFNTRATNKYRDRHYLVYAANVFMNVGEKMFYTSMGVEVNEDLYALSTMVQWIWRSAIRDGNEIYIYIPSRRMRELLTDWIYTLNRRQTDE